MWPFKAQPVATTLVEDLERLKREMRGLKSDIDDLWDRFRRLQGRLAKRWEKDDTPPELGTNGEGASDSTSPLSPTFSRLTDRQKQLQLQIMKRRAGMGGH